MPLPSKPDKEALTEAVRRVMAAEGSEEEIDALLDYVHCSVPHPAVSGLIFYPKCGEPTPEHVIEEALAYKPIVL